ncbi:MAG: hypothetical protein ACYTXA_29355 [Nostoc sp.]
MSTFWGCSVTPHPKKFLEEKLGVRRQAFAVGDRFLYWINWYYA